MSHGSTTWDHCLSLMPTTMLARELLRSYEDLESLYWKRVLAWLAIPFRKDGKIKFGSVKMRIIEKKIEIQQLGGTVPPFWSIN